MSSLPLRRRCAPALPIAGLLWAALLALPAAAASATTAATTALADPTRPPAGLAGIATVPGPGGSAVLTAQGHPSAPHSPHAAASQPVVQPLVPLAPLLQALHLPQQGAASAIVDNRLVRAGDKVGERTVLSIDSQGLLLRATTGNGTERLSLFGVSNNSGGSSSSGGSGNVGKVPAGSATVRSAASFTPARLPALANDADPPATPSRTSAVESPAAAPEPQVATKAKP